MIKDILKIKDQVFSRRAFIVLFCKLGIASLLLVRLFFLQVSRFSEFRTLSDKNRIKVLLLEPLRGLIKDRNGINIASNKNNYKLYFYKQRKVPYDDALQIIFSLLNISKSQRQDLIKKIQNSSYVYPILISEGLSWNQVALIEGNKYKLPGTYIDKGYIRYYPFKEMFAHVIGYMGVPRREEIEKHSLYNASFFKIGKTGIERLTNNKLIGKFGSKRVEVNAQRVIVREFSSNKSIKGEDVNLTFDVGLQKFVYELLPKDGATAVVTKIDSGEVLSMVSTPSFDSNIFSNKTMDRDLWDSIVKNKSYPFTNRAVAKTYPPGSVWKIVVALAILENGISPDEHVYCQGRYQVGNRVYRCWKHSGHGGVNLNSAMMMSCNIYFYEMSLRIGIAEIHRVAKELGFGDIVSSDIPGELKGLNPNKEWKKANYNSEWMLGDTVNSSIGQGFTMATPIQMLTMLSRVVVGKKVSPKVLTQNLSANSNTLLSVREKNLAVVKESLFGVFNHPKGLGYSLRIPEKKYWMAGKSGTAQIVSRDTSLLDVKLHKEVKSHAIFVGYAPFHQPKYAAVVAVDNVGWGVKNAAPLGREILYFVQNYFR